MTYHIIYASSNLLPTSCRVAFAREGVAFSGNGFWFSFFFPIVSDASFTLFRWRRKACDERVRFSGWRQYGCPGYDLFPYGTRGVIIASKGAQRTMSFLVFASHFCRYRLRICIDSPTSSDAFYNERGIKWWRKKSPPAPQASLQNVYQTGRPLDKRQKEEPPRRCRKRKRVCVMNVTMITTGTRWRERKRERELGKQRKKNLVTSFPPDNGMRSHVESASMINGKRRLNVYVWRHHAALCERVHV